MKLSELVQLRNYLSNLSTIAVRDSVNELDGMVSKVSEVPMHLDYKDTVSDMIHSIDKIEDLIDDFERTIPSLIEKIDKEILESTIHLYEREYTIEDNFVRCTANIETDRTIRTMLMHDETRAEVLVKARKYTNWKYPALEIGPGDGTWTEHLIAADPLYIVDIQQEFLDSTLSKFNPVYRNRVRPYLVGSHGIKDTDYSIFPQGQFGFIFSWNVFDYFPLSQIKDLLTQGMKLLKPGGYMMFSYNNCEVVQCVEFVELGHKTWAPKHLLVQACLDAGFEIVGTHSPEETVHWIEIKKPGELKTVKAHQVLGKIISRPT